MLSNCLVISLRILFRIYTPLLLLTDEGFFVYIMDNIVILNLLFHIYFFTVVLYQLLLHRGMLENWTS